MKKLKINYSQEDKVSKKVFKNQDFKEDSRVISEKISEPLFQ